MGLNLILRNSYFSKLYEFYKDCNINRFCIMNPKILYTKTMVDPKVKINDKILEIKG